MKKMLPRSPLFEVHHIVGAGPCKDEDGYTVISTRQDERDEIFLFTVLTSVSIADLRSGDMRLVKAWGGRMEPVIMHCMDVAGLFVDIP